MLSANYGLDFRASSVPISFKLVLQRGICENVLDSIVIIVIGPVGPVGRGVIYGPLLAKGAGVGRDLNEKSVGILGTRNV